MNLFRLSVLAALCGFSALVIAQSNSIQQPFAISINAPQAVLKKGTDVQVEITLTNISDRPMYLAQERYGPSKGYIVSVTDLKGTRTHFTQSFIDQKEKRIQLSSSLLTKLGPKESSRNQVFVNQIYDMSRPGDYLIQMWKSIPRKLYSEDDNLRGGIVKSNIIRVTITEKD